MTRKLKFFYWISGDSPDHSYELRMYVEDGQPLPTASEFQRTIAETNDRLAGAYLRMWKVSIPARNFDELLRHPRDPSDAVLPPEDMDMYFKDPPIPGHISFIVEEVRKGKNSDLTSSKRVQEGFEGEIGNGTGPSSRVHLETPAITSTAKPPSSSVATIGGATAAKGNMGPAEIIEIVPASSGADSLKRPSSDSGSQAESAPGPSKRVRVDDSATHSAPTAVPPSSTPGNTTTATKKTTRKPRKPKYGCERCGAQRPCLRTFKAHECVQSVYKHRYLSDTDEWVEVELSRQPRRLW